MDAVAAAAAVDEAAFELSKFGLAELMRKDQTRCKFHVNGKKKKEIIECCPSVIRECCPSLLTKMTDLSKPVELTLLQVKAFRNIMQFLHTSTLNLQLLRDLDDYVDFAKCNYLLKIPALMKLSLCLLQLQVNPSNVWGVLSQVVQCHELASVCDEVLQSQTRHCLFRLESALSSDMLIYFLKFDWMNISSEGDLLEVVIQYAKVTTNEQDMTYVLESLRFMTFSLNEVPKYLPLLSQLLSPHNLKAVLLAIKTGDATRLPINFNRSSRILPGKKKRARQVKKKCNELVENCDQIQKLISAAALQFKALKLGHLQNSSSVCILEMGNREEIVACPKLMKACCHYLKKKLTGKNGQKLELKHINAKGTHNFVKFVSTGQLDMSLLKSLDDYIDFWTANVKLKTMKLTMQLSSDLIQLKISPDNVWFVLGKLNGNKKCLKVCNKVLSVQTVECLQHMDNELNKHSLRHFLRLQKMNIDSEVQLVRAFENIKFTHSSKQKNLTSILVAHLRFMTLSQVEFASITPFLQKFLTVYNFKAVSAAVKSCNLSKMPKHFSKLNTQRKPSSPLGVCALNMARVTTAKSSETHAHHSQRDSLIHAKVETVPSQEAAEVKKEIIDISDEIVQVKKEKVQVKEEQMPVPCKREPERSIANEGRVKQKRVETNNNSDEEDCTSLNQKKPDAENQLGSASNELWEFIETNAAMQVRRKRPLNECPQVEPRKKRRTQTKIEPVDYSSSDEEVVTLEPIVHLELLQDSAQQSSKTVHQVQADEEKVIVNITVKKDLQLLGMELFAQAQDWKCSNKYKLHRIRPMYEEMLEVTVFNSELGQVFKESIQGQQALNTRLFLNASSTPVLPKGSRLKVKVKVLKGATYPAVVSNIMFKGADSVVAKASVQSKKLERGDWMPVDCVNFCPITKLILQVDK